MEKDGVSVKAEVDDDFFNELIGDEEKPEEVDDEFNGLVGEKEEAVFTKHEMTLVAKHRTTLHLLIP